MIITDEMKALVDNELGDIDTGYCHWGEYRDSTIKRIIELHEQSKPKPEPVAYKVCNPAGCVLVESRKSAEKLSSEYGDGAYQPLYTTPPAREPLSIDEIKLLDCDSRDESGIFDTLSFARAIEQAHEIGVTK